jgi:porin
LHGEFARTKADILTFIHRQDGLATTLTWLIVQSIVQYTLNPGGGAVDPKDASKSRKISNAIVVGLRSAISF